MLVVRSKSVDFEILSARLTILDFFIENQQNHDLKNPLFYCFYK